MKIRSKYILFLLLVILSSCAGESDDSTTTTEETIVKSIVRAAKDGLVEIDEDNVFKFDLKNPYEFNDNIDNYLIHNLDEEVLRKMIVIKQDVENGKLECIQRKCSYIPNENFYGTDSLVYTFDDPYFEDNHEITDFKVNFQVNPVNDSPYTEEQEIDVVEDSPVDFSYLLDDVDSDNENISIIFVEDVKAGVLDCTNNQCLYSPNKDFTGYDDFKIKLSDGETESSVYTMTFKVDPVNDAPVSENKLLEIDEDGSLPFEVLMTDVDNSYDNLSLKLLSNVQHGSLTCVKKLCNYSPNKNYFGEDSFSYQLTDGLLDSETYTITFQVNPINDKTTSLNISVDMDEDTVRDFELPINDVDNSDEQLTLVIVTEPSNGLLNCTTPRNCTYTPNRDYQGSDNFTYNVNDGTIDSIRYSVSFRIRNVNDAPIGAELNLRGDEDIPLNFSIPYVDIDNIAEELSVIITDNPRNGKIVCNNINCEYTGNLHYNGEDSFAYKLKDETLESPIYTANIVLNPINDRPEVEVSEQVVDVDQDVPLDFKLYPATDVEGDDLVYSLIGVPEQGTLTCVGTNGVKNDNSCSYTPPAGVADTAYEFKYNVTDGFDFSDEVTVRLNIIGHNYVSIEPKNWEFNDKELQINPDGSIEQIVQPPQKTLFAISDDGRMHQIEFGLAPANPYVSARLSTNGGSPSRTVVDDKGRVWVANRGSANITCYKPNTPNKGDMQYCFNPPSIGVGGGPRSLTAQKVDDLTTNVYITSYGSRPFLWRVQVTEGVNGKSTWKRDSFDFRLTNGQVPAAYGGVFVKETDTLWLVDRGKRVLFGVKGMNSEPFLPYMHKEIWLGGQCTHPYGIGANEKDFSPLVACYDHGGLVKYDLDTNKLWRYYSPLGPRGVGHDTDNYAWVSIGRSGTFLKANVTDNSCPHRIYNLGTALSIGVGGLHLSQSPGGGCLVYRGWTYLLGVSATRDGFVYAVEYHGSVMREFNSVRSHNINGLDYTGRAIDYSGSSAYMYSDFTGFNSGYIDASVLKGSQCFSDKLKYLFVDVSKVDLNNRVSSIKYSCTNVPSATAEYNDLTPNSYLPDCVDRRCINLRMEVEPNKDAVVAQGPELVPDANMNAGNAPWQKYNSQISFNNGKLEYTGEGSTNDGYLTISTTPGARYQIELDGSLNPSDPDLFIGAYDVNNNNLGNPSGRDIGWLGGIGSDPAFDTDGIFFASGNSTIIRIGSNKLDKVMKIDSISVREIGTPGARINDVIFKHKLQR